MSFEVTVKGSSLYFVHASDTFTNADPLTVRVCCLRIVRSINRSLHEIGEVQPPPPSRNITHFEDCDELSDRLDESDE